MKRATKYKKIREYLAGNPDTKPLNAAVKFGVDIKTIYYLRKQAKLKQAEPKQEVPKEIPVFTVVPSVNLQQHGGDHYVKMGVQPWQAMEAWMSPEAFVGFLRGNAIKYLARADKKGGAEDLRKARHYIDKLLEMVE